MKRLKDCIEELVKFTLISHINEALEFDLGISKQFCSSLLEQEPDDANFHSTGVDSDEDSLRGVPSYPLYKRLALALHRSVISRAFCRTYRDLALINEDGFLKQKEEEWRILILEKGSELINILEAVDFELDVQEPFFTMIKDGLKTVEGRCADGDYNRIGIGAVILVNKCVMLAVQSVRSCCSFSKMLEAESLVEVLPGVNSVEEGVKVYRKFYSEEKELPNGVLAISISKVAMQPYICLAKILFGLGYEGIQSFLGLAHTVGTVSDAVSPPRSTVFSSFMLPFNPKFKGSSLTHGARALAKHAVRSNDKYWGSLNGSDSNKNKLAMDIIGRLIANSSWLNVHIVQPHGAVFEIREVNGYGARWSKDGTKFIGFLEPYMEGGHLKGWKH